MNRTLVSRNSRKKGTLDLLGDALHRGIGPSLKKAARDAKDVEELESELGRTKTALRNEQHKLDDLEGKILFEPVAKVLTDGRRNIIGQSVNDPTGAHVFIQFKRYDVRDGNITRDQSAGNDVQVNRMNIRPYPSRIAGRDVSTHHDLFSSVFPDASTANHPLYHWRG